MPPLQQFVESVANSRNAGSKAVQDVTAILTRLGFAPIPISRRLSDNKLVNLIGRLAWVLHCPFWRMKVKRDATIVIQFTVSCFHGALAFRLVDEAFKRKKNLRVVAIVHDLNRSDPMKDEITSVERRFFALCDRIVVHNEKMREFLARHGVAEEKMVPLEAFDYLIEGDPPAADAVNPRQVVIAGNLNPDKCGYLKAIPEIAGVEWKLFGLGVDERQLGEYVRYCGSFDPHRPPATLVGGFGLVWDGDSAETCSGMFGEYMRVNNPHKMSLYLAMGLPVIVWKESAVAPFVARNRLGLLVGSLFEIPEAVSAAASAYPEFARNAAAVASRLRTGDFMMKAIQKCMM